MGYLVELVRKMSWPSVTSLSPGSLADNPREAPSALPSRSAVTPRFVGTAAPPWLTRIEREVVVPKRVSSEDQLTGLLAFYS